MVEVELRPAKEHDLELMLAWRSNPRVYEHFRDQDGPLAWDEHVDWFQSRASDRKDYIIEFEGRRVGAVAVTEDDEVSIYIGEFKARGQGIATEALEALIDQTERGELQAWIHRENEASRHLFERVGFEHQGSDGDWLRYLHPPGKESE